MGGDRRQRKMKNDERRAEIGENTHRGRRRRRTAMVTMAPPTISIHSAEMESFFTLISIPGDFGINHRHTCRIDFVQGEAA